MKLLLTLVCFLTLTASAQQFKGLDKSPMDMAYYPDDFAHDRKFAAKKEWNDKALVRITYSRPAMQERELFGKLVPFGKVWRIGANEAPEIRFYENATFGGKAVKAGDYALLAIPEENEWTIILSTDLDQWGAYSYAEKNDVFRIKVPAQKTDKSVENVSMRIVQEGDDLKKATLLIGWGNTYVEVPIGF